MSCVSNAQRTSTLEERKAVYQEIVDKFSPGEALELSYDENFGFHISAKKDLQPHNVAFKIPYEAILTPYEPFPYKKTILKIYKALGSKDKTVEIKGRKEMAQTSDRAPLLLKDNLPFLAAMLLYIERNLEANKFADVQMFRDKSAFNKAFLRSFPESLGALNDWDEDSYDFYRSISFMAERKTDFDLVHATLISTIKEVAEPEEASELVTLFNDPDELKY